MIWAEAEAVFDQAGEAISVIGTVQDITERKRAEEELFRLATAVESAADAVVITDSARGIIQYVNPAFEQITGYERGEVLGRDLHLLDSGKHEEAFYRDIRETLEQEGVWTGRLVNKKKDGTLYEEECTYSPVKNESGEITNYISIKRDVTEKARLESIAQAVDTMNNIGYIFSGVSHEIGNPINAISMTLSNMKKKLDTLSRERLAEYIDSLITLASRVGDLLKNLKTFNMYEMLKPQNIEIRAFMQAFLSMVKNDFEAKGTLINYVIDAEIPQLHADPRALQQVLLNVLTNAADALEERQNPRILIHVSGDAGIVRIRVQDNGKGIEESRMKSLFTPFFTTKEHGTGLGLVIIKKMLAKMNGTVAITSRFNEGTVVEIALPAGDK